MAGGKILSDKERVQIETFRQANYSIREIGKELNRSDTVFWNYLKTPEEYGTKIIVEDPKKLTIRQLRLLVRKLLYVNFQQIKLEMNLI